MWSVISHSLRDRTQPRQLYSFSSVVFCRHGREWNYININNLAQYTLDFWLSPTDRADFNKRRSVKSLAMYWPSGEDLADTNKVDMCSFCNVYCLKQRITVTLTKWLHSLPCREKTTEDNKWSCHVWVLSQNEWEIILPISPPSCIVVLFFGAGKHTGHALVT